VQPVLTAAETRTLDRETEARGTSIETLMERAGLSVARAAAVLAGGSYGRRAVVVAGKGNNGGDGLVAARLLSRWGVRVTVILLAEPSELRGAASTNLDRLGAERRRPFSEATLRRELDRADVAVDAIFGTGFRGTAEAEHAKAIEILNESGLPIVAADIPSGVEGDSGAVRGPAVTADATVTFGAPKVGDVLFPGAAHTGVLQVADIGFPRDLLRGDVQLTEASDVAALLAARPPETHKRATGVVLVIAGSRRMTGAPLLVARGAYRSGAGLVTVAVPETVLPIVQTGMAEATFLPLAEGPGGSVAERAWDDLVSHLEDFDAVAVGPGLSTDGETPAFARRLVAGSPIPVVIDADAINAFAGRSEDLARRVSGAVITPHAGEFGRLFGMPSSDVLEDRLGFTRKAAAETRAVVALKGSRTVIASPEGEVRINPTGTPVLATGGTGDVLAGAVAALLARGLPPLQAATAAAYVHGMAGTIAGAESGEGTTAPDVARALPQAVRRIREGG
jgi:ADP-dependent NAD(P)H-hydrate dehydratase / NAD(P)H-hydrate epimerase